MPLCKLKFTFLVDLSNSLNSSTSNEPFEKRFIELCVLIYQCRRTSTVAAFYFQIPNPENGSDFLFGSTSEEDPKLLLMLLFIGCITLIFIG